MWQRPSRARSQDVVAPVLFAVALVCVGCGAGGGTGEADRTAAASRPGPASSGSTDSTEAGGAGATGASSEEPDMADSTATGGTTPDVLTQDDDGARLTLAVGDEVPLRLDSTLTWSEPRPDGDAVVLTPVDYLVDPGYVEWLIGASSPGEATVEVSAEPTCDDVGQCPPAAVTIHVQVTG